VRLQFVFMAISISPAVGSFVWVGRWMDGWVSGVISSERDIACDIVLTQV
jgi:hypothetical protein